MNRIRKNRSETWTGVCSEKLEESILLMNRSSKRSLGLWEEECFEGNQLKEK